MSDSGQEASPPINNLLQPDIYNRLDAQALERTRVVNTQLDERLRAQTRLLAKYRLAAERCHRRETERLRTELHHMTMAAALPAISRIRDFRNKFLYEDYGLHRRKSTSSDSVPGLLQQHQQQQTRKKIRGVPEERCSLPFCERFFIHHLPSKRKYYKDPTPTPPPLPHVLSAREGGEGRDGGGGGGGEGGVGGSLSEAAAPPGVAEASEGGNVTELRLLNVPRENHATHHRNRTDAASPAPSGGGKGLPTSQTDDPTEQQRLLLLRSSSPNIVEATSSTSEAALKHHGGGAKNGADLSPSGHSGRRERAAGKPEVDKRSPRGARRPPRKLTAASLPSIGRQNAAVRLARSSPSLFQG